MIGWGWGEMIRLINGKIEGGKVGVGSLKQDKNTEMADAEEEFVQLRKKRKKKKSRRNCCGGWVGKGRD